LIAAVTEDLAAAEREARKTDALSALDKTVSAMLTILAGGSRERVVIEVLTRLKDHFGDLAQSLAREQDAAAMRDEVKAP
jgi:hypothetical protein